MNKIGVALSGGGAKALAQLPIITKMMDESIPIRAVAGTSMGSVIASLIACGVTSETLTQIIAEIIEVLRTKKKLWLPSEKLLPFNKEKIYGGVVDGDDIADIFDQYLASLGVEMIRDVTIPLAIPAVDLVSGKTIVFVSHPESYINNNENVVVISDAKLSTAVRASCAFPFVIASVPLDDYYLVDGGLSQNLPLESLLGYGVDKSIAITLHTEEDFHDLNAPTALASRVYNIMRTESDRVVSRDANIHVNISLQGHKVFNFDRMDDILALGETAAKEWIDAIKEVYHKG